MVFLLTRLIVCLRAWLFVCLLAKFVVGLSTGVLVWLLVRLLQRLLEGVTVCLGLSTGFLACLLVMLLQHLLVGVLVHLLTEFLARLLVGLLRHLLVELLLAWLPMGLITGLLVCLLLDWSSSCWWGCSSIPLLWLTTSFSVQYMDFRDSHIQGASQCMSLTSLTVAFISLAGLPSFFHQVQTDCAAYPHALTSTAKRYVFQQEYYQGESNWGSWKVLFC